MRTKKEILNEIEILVEHLEQFDEDQSLCKDNIKDLKLKIHTLYWVLGKPYDLTNFYFNI